MAALTLQAGETYSLFSGPGVKEEIVPKNRDHKDPKHELGLYFLTSKPGVVTAVRYWKPPSEGGEHVGRIWNTNGAELASAAFTNETKEGWQEAKLGKPLRLEPNVRYIVSVNQHTHVAFTCGIFAKLKKWENKGYTNGPLSSWQPEKLCDCEWECADGVKANGPFSGTPGKMFPILAGENSNFFRDVVFVVDESETKSKEKP